MRGAAVKPYFVPETMKADVLFTNMKETRNHFAIVIDEYGGTRGVITMHDLLELLVGDLGEKDDDYIVEIKKTDDSCWEIMGSALLKDVEEELDLELSEDDYDTFGGYIFGLLEAIPDDGTQLELETEDLVIRVESIEDHRVERTVVIKKKKDETDED
jgi:putative hemolysin